VYADDFTLTDLDRDRRVCAAVAGSRSPTADVSRPRACRRPGDAKKFCERTGLPRARVPCAFFRRTYGDDEARARRTAVGSRDANHDRASARWRARSRNEARARSAGQPGPRCGSAAALAAPRSDIWRRPPSCPSSKPSPEGGLADREPILSATVVDAAPFGIGAKYGKVCGKAPSRSRSTTVDEHRHRRQPTQERCAIERARE